MRRIKSIAAALVLVVALVAALPGAAAADEHIWEVDDLGDLLLVPAVIVDEEEDFVFNDVFEDGLSQETEQDAESGDLSQTAEVSLAGENSNQTVGDQLTGNTGNTQSEIGLIDAGGFSSDYEFEEVGSSIEVSPESSVESGQAVDQAATAFGS